MVKPFRGIELNLNIVQRKICLEKAVFFSELILVKQANDYEMGFRYSTICEIKLSNAHPGCWAKDCVFEQIARKRWLDFLMREKSNHML